MIHEEKAHDEEPECKDTVNNQKNNNGYFHIITLDEPLERTLGHRDTEVLIGGIGHAPAARRAL